MKLLSKSKFLAVTCLTMLFSLSLWANNPVSLLNERNGEITLQFNVPEYTIGTQTVNGIPCATVTAGGEPPTFEKGYPELPYFVQSVLIGINNLVSLDVVDVKYKEIPIAKVTPSRGSITRNIDPATVPYTFSSVYSQDTWYPEKPANITEPFILRDLRGVTVQFYPFQYNGAKGVLRVAEQMVVKVKTTGTARNNILTKTPQVTSQAFEHVYEGIFINYTQNQYGQNIVDGDKMIIIAPDKYKADLAPFIAWKNRKGIKTTFYSTTEAGSSGTAIQTFIKSKYTSDKITYVLLVGDFADVTSITAGGGKSDPSYALVGSDTKYPAVFVGRFSVETTNELKTIVNKSISYEMTPDMNGDWYGNAICNGSKDDGGTGNPDYKWMKEFSDSLKAGGYVKADVYSENGVGGNPAGTATTTNTAINSGISWFNYMGHGSQTAQTAPSYSSSNITSLSNNNKYPVCVSVACFNGQFDNATCIGESWIRAGSPTAGKGGIVYVGSYISQAWVPPQYGVQGMMSMIKQQKFLSVGYIIYNGEIKMITKYNGQDENTYLTWHYFGDPSIFLIMKKPEQVTLSHPAKLSVGSQTFDVTGPDNTIACVYGSTQDIWSAKTITGGKATFTIDVKNATDTIFVTGVGKNKAPYLGSINNGITNIADNMTLSGTKAGIAYQHLLNNVLFNYPEKTTRVTIAVFGLNGKQVYSKTVTPQSSINSTSWNFTNNEGTLLAHGVYHAIMSVTLENGMQFSINRNLFHN